MMHLGRVLSLISRLLLGVVVCAAIATLPGCGPSSSHLWENTKSLGRYIHRRGELLFHDDVDSKMLASDEEFVGPQETSSIGFDEGDLDIQRRSDPTEQRAEPPPIFAPVCSEQEPLHIVPVYVQFDQIYFDTNEHQVKTAANYRLLSQIAQKLQRDPSLVIDVEGHCDQRGSEEYNLSLGTRRAHEVVAFLIRKGVDPRRLRPISRGKERPADPRNIPEAWTKNRRVEFKVYQQPNL